MGIVWRVGDKFPSFPGVSSRPQKAFPENSHRLVSTPSPYRPEHKFIRDFVNEIDIEEELLGLDQWESSESDAKMTLRLLEKGVKILNGQATKLSKRDFLLMTQSLHRVSRLVDRRKTDLPLISLRWYCPPAMTWALGDWVKYTTMEISSVAAKPSCEALYRKAYPRKRQPSHWRNGIVTYLFEHVDYAHLCEVMVFYCTGLLSSPPDYIIPETAEQYLSLFRIYDDRSRLRTHIDEVSEFFCDPKTELQSVFAVSLFFNHLVSPFNETLQKWNPGWTRYLQNVEALKSFVGKHGIHSEETDSAVVAFTSTMASAGPAFSTPVAFFSSMRLRYRGRNTANETLLRLARCLRTSSLFHQFLFYPYPLESDLLYVSSEELACLPNAELVEDLRASLRFCYLIGEVLANEMLMTTCCDQIKSFYLSRVGPSSIKGKIGRAGVEHVIKLLAKLWHECFFHAMTFDLPVSVQEAQLKAMQTRFSRHRIADECWMSFANTLQYCNNCEIVHTAHNSLLAPGPRSRATVLCAHQTIGTAESCFKIVQTKDGPIVEVRCGRQGSRISANCANTPVRVIKVEGLLYKDFELWVICVECGIVCKYDSSVLCYIRGPLCSYCSSKRAHFPMLRTVTHPVHFSLATLPKLSDKTVNEALRQAYFLRRRRSTKSEEKQSTPCRKPTIRRRAAVKRHPVFARNRALRKQTLEANTPAREAGRGRGRGRGRGQKKKDLF